MRYFDTHRVERGKFPEKHFFCGVMYAVRAELIKAMVCEIIDKKN
jgi:hypothetical protein